MFCFNDPALTLLAMRDDHGSILYLLHLNTRNTLTGMREDNRVLIDPHSNRYCFTRTLFDCTARYYDRMTLFRHRCNAGYFNFVSMLQEHVDKIGRLAL